MSTAREVLSGISSYLDEIQDAPLDRESSIRVIDIWRARMEGALDLDNTDEVVSRMNELSWRAFRILEEQKYLTGSDTIVDLQEETAAKMAAYASGPHPTSMPHQFTALRLASQGRSSTEAADWSDEWTESAQMYDRFSRPWVESMLDHFEQQGMIGDRVADVGCSTYPYSDSLKKPGRKIVQVDIAGARESDGIYGLQLNVDRDRFSIEEKKRLLACQKHLGSQKLDTVISANLLNYTDFERYLERVVSVLRKRGRHIIFNTPLRGRAHLLSSKGVMENTDLVKALVDGGHTIEVFQQTPTRLDAKRFERNTSLIVARKD